MNGRVLIIAGSDSGGGAGIQADIKTVTALGGFAMTAVTALTAQNTEGVTAIQEVPPEFIAEQMRVVLTDLGADSVKVGMLHSPDVITAVYEALQAHAPDVPVVLDPVMVAKGGAKLLQDAAVDALKRLMLPLARVITPNLPEAEVLTGLAIRATDDYAAAGAGLTALGPRAILLKGGHLAGPMVVDRLIEDGRVVATFEDARIDTRHTHGTGCTLSSAIATGIAQGMTLEHAVARARAYVRAAILSAPGYGRGHGPLNHGHTVAPFEGG